MESANYFFLYLFDYVKTKETGKVAWKFRKISWQFPAVIISLYRWWKTGKIVEKTSDICLKIFCCNHYIILMLKKLWKLSESRGKLRRGVKDLMYFWIYLGVKMLRKSSWQFKKYAEDLLLCSLHYLTAEEAQKTYKFTWKVEK